MGRIPRTIKEERRSKENHGFIRIRKILLQSIIPGSRRFNRHCGSIQKVLNFLFENVI